MARPIKKPKRLRSPKLLDAPRHENCVVAGCFAPAVGVCHLPHNLWGFPAGIGQKTHDWLGAHLCHEHHGYCDGDGRNDHAWRAMVFARTIERLIARGVLVIAGEQHAHDDLPF